MPRERASLRRRGTVRREMPAARGKLPDARWTSVAKTKRCFSLAQEAPGFVTAIFRKFATAITRWRPKKWYKRGGRLRGGNVRTRYGKFPADHTAWSDRQDRARAGGGPAMARQGMRQGRAGGRIRDASGTHQDVSGRIKAAPGRSAADWRTTGAGKEREMRAGPGWPAGTRKAPMRWAKRAGNAAQSAGVPARDKSLRPGRRGGS